MACRVVRCIVPSRTHDDGNNNEKHWTPNSTYFVSNLYYIRILVT